MGHKEPPPLEPTFRSGFGTDGGGNDERELESGVRLQVVSLSDVAIRKLAYKLAQESVCDILVHGRRYMLIDEFDNVLLLRVDNKNRSPREVGLTQEQIIDDANKLLKANDCDENELIWAFNQPKA